MIEFKRILYPVNLDAKDNENINIAIEFARQYSAELHFLYVNDTDAGYRHPTDFQDAVALKIKKTVPDDILINVKTVYAVAKGDIDNEIKVYCRERRIDLIITSHKHHGKFYSAIFDTPDESIIDSVKIPVFLLPK